MGFLSDILLAWSTKRHKKDIERFISILKGLDDEEIFSLYRFIQDAETEILCKCLVDIRDPFLAIEKNDSLVFDIYKLVKKEQANPALASGLSVWLFTVRAALNPELRYLGKEMWAQIGRVILDPSEYPKGFLPNG